MSFILDALKKSETERQSQAGADFSNVPSSAGEVQSFKWLWILALLLAVNAAVLVGILLRSGESPTEPPPVSEPAAMPATPAEAAEPTFAERVAVAREAQNERAETAPPAATEPEPASASRPVPQPAASTRVRTIDELRLTGALQLTDLHLDIHVYSEKPAERFVFVNMNKYREGDTLEEGPDVDEITPDGVILAYRGLTFLLPRE
jgi:general secretion pathway protein B